jgi:hypothetical protein
MVGRVRQRENPARIPTSRNWSGLSESSINKDLFSTNVNDEGKSIEVMIFSTGQRRASFDE